LGELCILMNMGSYLYPAAGLTGTIRTFMQIRLFSLDDPLNEPVKALSWAPQCSHALLDYEGEDGDIVTRVFWGWWIRSALNTMRCRAPLDPPYKVLFLSPSNGESFICL